MILHGLTTLFWGYNHKAIFNQLSWCFEDIPHFHFHSMTIADKFQLLKLSFLPWEELILYKTSNISRTFLWKLLDNNFLLKDPPIDLNQFDLFHIKLVSCVMSLPCCPGSPKEALSNSPSSSGPVIHLKQHNQYYKQFAFGSEFQLVRLFRHSKINRDRLLKPYQWVLIASFHFRNNSNTTFSYSNCSLTEVKKKKLLRNMSELLACQYCHLLMIYNMGGITSRSALIHRISTDGK